MPRDKAIESPEQLLKYFLEYKEWILTTPYLIHDFVGKDATEVHRKKTRPLTWSGFEAFLARNGVVTQLTHYEQNGRDAYAEYLPIISRIKAECRGDVIDGALSGLYNANLAARIEGLKDASEVTVNADRKAVADLFPEELTSDGPEDKPES